MKKSLLTLLSVICVVFAAEAQTKTPTTHQTNSIASKGTSPAICQVTFNAVGQVKSVVMTKSTGSTVLDGEMADSTRQQLSSGPPNRAITIPIMCKVVETSTSQGKMVIRVATTHPPYPFQARARHEQGSGVVQASFDERGNAVSVVMAQSTGSKILDGNTINYALTRWKSSGGEKVTTTFPVTYQLR